MGSCASQNTADEGGPQQQQQSKTTETKPQRTESQQNKSKAPAAESKAPAAGGLPTTGSLGEFSPKGPFETRNFINGEFVKSRSGKTFSTINPATEEVIAQVEDSNAQDVDVAVAAAREAFDDYDGPWKKMDASGRRNLLLALAKKMEENRLYLGKLEALNNGKPYQNAGYNALADVDLSIQVYKYYAGWTEKHQGKSIPVDGEMFCFTSHEPVGVCGQIIPWNFPLLMQAWKLAPALATGCTVVLKTSEKTPLSGLAVAKLIQEVGYPAGVVNIISGYGPSVGEPLALHMDVDKVAFTGSSAVGHKIMEYSARSNLKRYSLELGGKSPLIVLPDADMDQAVEAAHIGLFLNHGQCCCASSRLFVHEDIYDTFVQKAAAKAKDWQVGDQFSSTSMQGPLVDKIQFDKVMNYISTGKEQGARLVAGGGRHGEQGYFVEPTVFADVEDDMTIAKEEIFGPVMSIIKFSDVKDAIKRANATKYGLAAGICTRDIGKVFAISEKLKAGTVWVNCYNAGSPLAPFGGFKESGVGRELGEYGLSAYTEVKTVFMPIDGKLD